MWAYSDCLHGCAFTNPCLNTSCCCIYWHTVYDCCYGAVICMVVMVMPWWYGCCTSHTHTNLACCLSTLLPCHSCMPAASTNQGKARRGMSHWPTNQPITSLHDGHMTCDCCLLTTDGSWIVCICIVCQSVTTLCGQHCLFFHQWAISFEWIYYCVEFMDMNLDLI